MTELEWNINGYIDGHKIYYFLNLKSQYYILCNPDICLRFIWWRPAKLLVTSFKSKLWTHHIIDKSKSEYTIITPIISWISQFNSIHHV